MIEIPEGCWWFEYVPDADAWDFHAPEYEPEVSLKAGVRDGNWIAAFYKESSMPMTLREYLGMLISGIDFQAARAQGAQVITLPKEETLKASQRMQVMRDLKEREN